MPSERTRPLKFAKKGKTSIFDLYDAEDASKRYGEKNPKSYGDYFKLVDRMKSRRPFEVARDISGSKNSNINLTDPSDEVKDLITKKKKSK